MRLLTIDSQGNVALTSYRHDAPAYAILSHTWGADDNEITFADIEKNTGKHKMGYAKLWFCVNQARKDGLDHCWVDTCCINKSDHVELSEAITSMFRWYQQAARCYVYLSDVSVGSGNQHTWEDSFRASRWFTRGWTLQELLAPAEVEFFSAEGQRLGSKQTLEDLIHSVTHIPVAALRGTPLSTFTVIERLRWTENRVTKKEEDKAYCLLGIFGVYMPLIYGEGDNASIRLFAEIEKAVDSTPSSMHTHWVVARTPNPLFTGREDILQTLGSTISDNLAHPSFQDQCRIVISGMGGQGKSEIALQLAHRFRPKFWGVFWIDVRSASLAEQSFLHLAQKLSLPVQTGEGACLGLAKLKQPWLLVLDNADDPDLDYRPYIPSSPLGVVVITSRNEECHQYATVPPVVLDGLSNAAAQDMLLKAARIPVSQYGSSKKDAARVATLLQSHPLALIQAAAYISRGHCSLSQYPTVYERHRSRLLQYRPTNAQARYGDTYATFEASADALRGSDMMAAADALELLPLLAVCGTSQLPLIVFSKAWEGAQKVSPGTADDADDDEVELLTPWHVSQLPAFLNLSDRMWDSFRLVEAVQLLKAFALVTLEGLDETMTVSMHPLVHAWARDRQHADEQYTHWLSMSCVVACAEMAGIIYILNRPLRAHVETLVDLDMSTMFMGSQSILVARVLVRCGWLLDEMRSDNKLTLLIRRLLSHLHLDTRVVAQAWLGLFELAARNLNVCGKPQESISLLEQALELRKQSVAAGQTYRVLSTQQALAGAYLANGQLAEAVSLLEEVFKIRVQTLAETHPARLASQQALAGAYLVNKQVAAAVLLLEEAVRIQDQTLTKTHPARLASEQALAGAYLANGQLAEAVSLLEEVVDIRRRALATDHPDRLESQHELARAYKDSGRIPEAVSLLEEVVEIRRQTLAEDHPGRRKSQRELARAYRDNGQVAEAVSLLEEVVHNQKQTLVEDDSDRLVSQYELATVRYLSGQVAAAAVALEEVIDIQRQTLAQDHPSLLRSLHTLSTYLCDLGRQSEGLQMMRHVVAVKRQTLATSNPSRQHSEQCLQELELVGKVGEIGKQTPAEDHPNRPDFRESLSNFLLDLGRRSRGRPESQKQPLGEPHLDRLSLGVSELYSGASPGNASARAQFDLVAVHGPGGHPLKSFTDGSNDVCWLRDLLPLDFPACRVFTFGYDSAKSDLSAGANLRDHALSLLHDLSNGRTSDTAVDNLYRGPTGGTKVQASRPIVLVGHSLGGLIVKEALVCASKDDGYHSLYSRIRAVFFFGTPHKGPNLWSTIAKVQRISEARAVPDSEWTAGFQRPLRRDFSRKSELLLSTDEEFKSLGHHMSIYSFYETGAVATGALSKRIIVQRDSAVLGMPGEKAVSLKKDQASICKFSGPEDIAYQQVARCLRDSITNAESGKFVAEDNLAHTTRPAAQPEWNPDIITKHGKTAMGLLAMAGSMENPDDLEHASFDVVAIHGLGGSPKQTWVHRGSRAMWLRDFLTTDLPSGRICSYGYESELAMASGSADLKLLADDFLLNIVEARSGKVAGRPLILICYSFGGLMLKMAMLRAKDRAQHQTKYWSLLRSIVHIVFLGVPHRDDDPLFTSLWTGIIECTLRTKIQSSAHYGETMAMMSSVSKQFRKAQWPGLRVTSIAESEPVKTTSWNTILVPRTSVLLDWGSQEEAFVSEARNHLQLPQFYDSSDQTYLLVRDALEGAATRLEVEAGSRDLSLLFPRQRHLFQAQIDHVDRIYEAPLHHWTWIFESEVMRTFINGGTKSLLIFGPAGSGKSTLAKALAVNGGLAQQAQSMITVLTWFFGTSSGEIAESTVLAFLITQLVQSQSDLMAHVSLDFFNPDLILGSEHLWRDLEALIHFHNSEVIVVLDGLDESGSQIDVPTFCTRLDASPGARILCTSRERPPLSSGLSKLDITWNSDIADYIVVTLAAKFPRPLSQQETAEAARRIMDKGDGVILWAHLALQMLLSDPSSDANMITNIERLPSDLDQLYELAASRALSGKDKSLHREVLSVLLTSLSTASMRLLIDFLSVPSDWCGPIIISEDELRDCLATNIFITADGAEVFFTHRTAHDYLLRAWPIRLADGKCAGLEQLHLHMAEKCVARLLRETSEVTEPTDQIATGSFTDYAAENWLKHISECQEVASYALVDASLTLLRKFHEQSHPRWIQTDDALHHSQFPIGEEPLLAAAFLGIKSIMEVALEQGADVGYADGSGKTALHYVSEGGGLENARLLLRYGADINARSHLGWTSLHLAASHGHESLIDLFLGYGASTSIVTSDGRSPLQLALEGGEVRTVSSLLRYNAAVPLQLSNGNSIWTAAKRDGGMRKLLVDNESSAGAILSQAIDNSDLQTLRELFESKQDLITKPFPWTQHLLDAKVSSEEVLDLLLKSENLDWNDDEPIDHHPQMEYDSVSLTFLHHQRCAHSLPYLRLGPDGTLTWPKGASAHHTETSLDEARQVDPALHDSHLVEWTDSDSVSSSNYPKSAAADLDELEQLDYDLISYVGIGGVFPPRERPLDQIRPLNPGTARFKGSFARLSYSLPKHQSQVPLEDRKPILALPARTVNSTLLLQESTHQAVTSPGRVEFDSAEDFDDASSVASLDSLGSESSFDSVLWPDHGFDDDDKTKRLLEALNNLLRGISHLNATRQCCERLTVLLTSEASNKCIEVKILRVSVLQRMCVGLRVFDGPEYGEVGWTSTLYQSCLDGFNDLGLRARAEAYVSSVKNSGRTPDIRCCLHLCALYVQLASICLVTYNRGHSREFYSPCLTRPIDRVVLAGFEDEGPSLWGERLDLSCLGGMLRRPAWVFHMGKGFSENRVGRKAFDVVTTPENLLDTWGGSITMRVDDDSKRICIHTGGGVLTREDVPVPEDRSLDGAISCHWEANLAAFAPDRDHFPIDANLHIGTTSPNDDCPLLHRREEYATFLRDKGHLVSLNVREPSWKTTGRTAGMSGGQYVNINFGITQTKDDGQNKKQVLLGKSARTIERLTAPWGLEVSICTGIARRVAIRRLIYGEALVYLEHSLWGRWESIRDFMAKVADCTNEDLRAELSQLSAEQSDVLDMATELIVNAMEHTGLSKDRRTLTLWWPEWSETRGIQFRREQLAGADPWMLMVQDSSHCAVFGMATHRCLQHSGRRSCLHSSQPTRPFNLNDLRGVMLDTALVPVSRQSSTPHDWDAFPRYYLYGRTDVLETTRDSPHRQANSAIHFNYMRTAPVVLPKFIRLKMNICEVKERQSSEDTAQAALIC